MKRVKELIRKKRRKQWEAKKQSEEGSGKRKCMKEAESKQKKEAKKETI